MCGVKPCLPVLCWRVCVGELRAYGAACTLALECCDDCVTGRAWRTAKRLNFSGHPDTEIIVSHSVRVKLLGKLAGTLCAYRFSHLARPRGRKVGTMYDTTLATLSGVVVLAVWVAAAALAVGCWLAGRSEARMACALRVLARDLARVGYSYAALRSGPWTVGEYALSMVYSPRGSRWARSYAECLAWHAAQELVARKGYTLPSARPERTSVSADIHAAWLAAYGGLRPHTDAMPTVVGPAPADMVRTAIDTVADCVSETVGAALDRIAIETDGSLEAYAVRLLDRVLGDPGVQGRTLPGVCGGVVPPAYEPNTRVLCAPGRTVAYGGRELCN